MILPIAPIQEAGPSRAADKNQVQVIARAGAILRTLEDSPLGLSLGQIAQRVGLARSTVQRIVAALAAEQLLIAASPAGRVRLGPALLRLAGSVQTDFVALARPSLLALSAELRETVDLSMLKKTQIVFIDQVVGPQRLRTVSAVGEAFPLHCSSNGKACLAQMTDAQVERLIGRVYEPRTPHSITDLGVLLADLAEVRRTGIAYDHQENALGVSAAAVALQDLLGNSIAVSIPAPTHRFTEHAALITLRLLQTRAGLLAKLSG